MKRLMIVFGLLSIILVFFSNYPRAQLFDDVTDKVSESLDKGEVNWTSQMLRAKGSGAPSPDASNPAIARLGAIRAAKMDALRNALETVKGVRLTSEATIENFMATSDTIMTHVQGYVQGARLVDTKYLSDGSIEVIMEIPLSGLTTKSLLPSMGESISKIPTKGDSIYTGLIIDARGLGVLPAMAPRILDEDGLEVYGSSFVSREYANKMGIVGYAKDMSKAKDSDRVADNPMVIKGIKKSGKMDSDIVISKADADKLREASGDLSFLEKCKVIILVD